MLEINQYRKFDEVTFIIYANRKCLIEKIDVWKNNPDKSSTTKVNIYTIRFSNVYNIVI